MRVFSYRTLLPLTMKFSLRGIRIADTEFQARWTTKALTEKDT